MNTLSLDADISFPLAQDCDLKNIVNKAFAYKDDVWDLTPFLR